MNYQCEVVIFHQSLEQVSFSLINENLYPLWQPSFHSTTPLSDEFYKQNSARMLHYSSDNEILDMKEEIIQNDLPHRIILEYSLPGVINRCDNQFKKINDEIHWLMDVTFNFTNPPEIDIDVFKAQTMKSMCQFKEFIESYNV